MEKIKVSELFSKSVYHDTVADEELIKAVLQQSQKKTALFQRLSFQNIIITVGLITIGILIYNIYTIIYTDRFIDTSDTKELSWETQGSWIYNPNRESELLEQIDTIFTQ